MPNIKAHGIQIEYETFGDKSSPALLLIIGIGSQMIDWDEALCREFAENGRYVIRFDNRDTGLGAKFGEAGIPDMIEAFTNLAQGKPVKSPYTLDDMADDAVGLLDELGIEKAHVCGMSMGGMIGQTMAIRHPERLLSLVSIYSTTGEPGLPQMKPETAAVFFSPPPKDRKSNIPFMVNLFKTIAGPGFPFDEEWHRKHSERRFDRSFYPEGTLRQLMAVLAHGSRKKALASVKVPTLVIHGSDDPVFPVENGRATAEAIPGSKLMIIEGMGHDLPHDGAWPSIVKAVIDHTEKAGV